jgi:hypothetical protein
MFRLIRFLVTASALVVFIWFGMTVPLGKETLFGHVRRIWQSEEAKDLVEGTKEAAKPAAEKVKRAVKAGVDEAGRDP